MISISVYLAHLSKAADTFQREKDTLVAIVRKVSGVSIPNESIVLGKNKISLNVSGSKKAALFLKREELEKEFTAYFASVTEVR